MQTLNETETQRRDIIIIHAAPQISHQTALNLVAAIKIIRNPLVRSFTFKTSAEYHHRITYKVEQKRIN